jgi:hypothetical protein
MAPGAWDGVEFCAHANSSAIMASATIPAIIPMSRIPELRKFAIGCLMVSRIILGKRIRYLFY